jgi:hypothetical protein
MTDKILSNTNKVITENCKKRKLLGGKMKRCKRKMNKKKYHELKLRRIKKAGKKFDKALNNCTIVIHGLCDVINPHNN